LRWLLALAAIKVGARGYLLKDADSDELIAVIERVARGETALDPADDPAGARCLSPPERAAGERPTGPRAR